MGFWFRHYSGNDCISESRTIFTARGRNELLAPFLQPRPELREGSEFRATANEDGDLAFQRVGIVGRLAHVFDVLKKAFQHFSGIVQHDQTIPRIAARAPQKLSLVAAEGARQSVAAAKEIDRARLPVILRDNTAAPAFFGRKSDVGLVYLGHDLFPSKFICEVLREDGAHVAVFAARNFERE